MHRSRRRTIATAAGSRSRCSPRPAATTSRLRPTPPTRGAGGATIHVPEDHDTIQAAVDAAAPGDLVLIAPGTYEEAVDVETENLTIRGLDRNEVILDGGFELENGIRVLADGVAVENMTAQNYTTNGFFWTGVTGYRGSYLTAFRNGDYGVYAFDATKGQLEHIYASGSPDAGVYIGQCYPCDAVIDDVVSEYNGLGYSGTNSGGNLLIVNSTFRYNRAGIVPNSGSYELCYPGRDNTIVGNIVHDNMQPDTPAIDDALLGDGQRHPGRRQQPQRHRAQPRLRPRAGRDRPRALPRGGGQRRRPRSRHLGHAVRRGPRRPAGGHRSRRPGLVLWDPDGELAWSATT